MALLGSDFNPAVPTDGAYTRHPSQSQCASTLRDLKSRLLSFFGKKFDVDSGQLKPNTVPMGAWKSIAPSPAGTWRRVRVRESGLVEYGDNVVQTTAPGFRRAVFYGSASLSSFRETDSEPMVLSGKLDTSPSGSSAFVRGSVSYFGETAVFSFIEYKFVVPDGVTRLTFFQSGGSPWVGADLTVEGGKSPYVTTVGTVACKPGDLFRVFAGIDAVSPTRVAKFDNSWYIDNTAEQSLGTTKNYRPSAAPLFRKLGGVQGNPSVVILEWTE